MPQAELFVTLRPAIDECVDTEALDEALQLAVGHRALDEVHEVCFDPSLREESKRFSGVDAFLYTEDLHFHESGGWELATDDIENERARV